VSSGPQGGDEGACFLQHFISQAHVPSVFVVHQLVRHLGSLKDLHHVERLLDGDGLVIVGMNDK
jgi:hypothetical protein